MFRCIRCHFFTFHSIPFHFLRYHYISDRLFKYHFIMYHFISNYSISHFAIVDHLFRYLTIAICINPIYFTSSHFVSFHLPPSGGKVYFLAVSDTGVFFLSSNAGADWTVKLNIPGKFTGRASDATTHNKHLSGVVW